MTQQRFGYLGPEATFTEAALLKLDEARGAERVPMPNVLVALDAVRTGDIDAAVVPIENSVEGGVPATLDALTSDIPLQIVREIVIPVKFVLAAPSGVELADITAYSTHPHAEAQTRRFTGQYLPDAAYLPAGSTAAAAAGLSAEAIDRGAGQDRAGQAEYQAAICPLLAAERYGLNVLADDIGDVRTAVTRFVLVRKPGPVAPATGADKTTLVAGLRSERPGALLELLEQFAVRGVNLTRIESRPTGDGLGLYQFSLDVDGHIDEARVAEALAGVHRTSRHVRFLGSYPRDDREASTIDAQNTDDAFAQANDWLTRIKGDTRG
ncbi:prephenate dehydratase [Saxibacter everestensis]|uniref:Prephenate dehydratase n=1 Tax=Saxibacter everestensis TaxID=2909229 RepID=A0ABY8QQM6_9MICO|nr:prephenate dehydratase [Brevibacteriaceae bacterium ZFBP1038]